MTLDQAVELLRHALFIALLVAAPVLAVGLVVGLIVAFLQAATNIQDQTLSLVPRIVAMLIVATVLLPWAGQRLLELARQAFDAGVVH